MEESERAAVEEGNKSLPVGWRWTRLLDVTRHHSGNSKLIKGKLSDAPADDLFPAFSASGQDVWRKGYESEGDAIVVSAVGARCGKCFLATGKWSAIANTHVVWPQPDSIDRKFLWYRINDEQFWIRSGSAQPFVVVRKTFEQPIPLPPLHEQERIVAEIEKQFTRLDAGVTSLKHVQAALKRYRASVLKAACEGRLVLSDKAKWHELTLPDFCSPAANSIRRGPFGSAIKKEFFVPSGYKVYQQQNAIYDDCSLGDYYIDSAKFRELASFEVKPNDLIISCSGTIGKIAIVPSWGQAGVINQALLKITLDQGVVLNAFFVIMFRSRVRELLIAAARGAAMQNIAGVAELKKMKWRIPPLDEQHLIVAEVERRLSLIEELKDVVSANLQRANRFQQSILHCAFEGRTV